jgi:hypothetical protein
VTQQSITTVGLADLQRRIALLGERLKPGALRRPSVDVAKQLVLSNKRRLGRGVDVNGRPLQSEIARKLGLVPLGGEHGLFGKSIRAEPMTQGDGVDLYSTFIGAAVAYDGKVITPKHARFLTIPIEAKGGEFSHGDGSFLAAGLGIKENTTARRARDYEDTFVLDAHGSLFIVQNDKRKKFSEGNKRKLRFLFLLVRSIRYPKNEWLGVSNDDSTNAIEVYGTYLDTFAGGAP